ncbi:MULTISPECIES: hypothetical protein [Pseudomonas]|uniref:hypothetical protein n=1 Tax=Pseudomonas TaxID=286 RepID=UPI000778CD1C|nr:MULTISPECIES: hypothetical protein [Pseudomonas]KYC18428.1 hypothetical protein WM94_20395 [Pseudomonas sp. ABFPK]MBA6112913.1 hypothetical protein [Pseudomonas asiatica]
MINMEPGLIALILITSIAIAITVQIYVAHKYTEHFESFLPTSRIVSDNIKNYKHAGLIGKLVRTGQIATLLATPKIFTYRGAADIEEVQKFPRRERLVLVNLWAIHIILFLALVLSHYL